MYTGVHHNHRDSMKGFVETLGKLPAARFLSRNKGVRSYIFLRTVKTKENGYKEN
jgi:hypothetical protein